MAPDLHRLISGFVEASNSRDTDRLLAFFSDDAVVRDEGNAVDLEHRFTLAGDRIMALTIQP
jgi:ketosteroid isomerase-like protein